MVTSTGSAGDCCDNAMAESFFATLECELIDRRSFQTQAEARMAIFEYLEAWYNTRRLHSALGYLSPNEFERRAAAGGPMDAHDHHEQTTLEPFQPRSAGDLEPPSGQTPNTGLRQRVPSTGYRPPQCRWRQPSTVHRNGVGPVVSTTAVLFERVDELNAQLDELDKQMRMLVRENEELRRLTTIPGVGEVTALAVHAFAPSMDSFARGRDFAAWIGLTPREISTGGRQRLGRITKMGQRDLRQLLVLGATAVVRHARRRKEFPDPWLCRMLAEKPAKLVAVALANIHGPPRNMHVESFGADRWGSVADIHSASSFEVLDSGALKELRTRPPYQDRGLEDHCSPQAPGVSVRPVLPSLPLHSAQPW